MKETERRAKIKQIQDRQCRYRAMGRCWCGREVRDGYKRCDNCMTQITQRRAQYQENGRCYCGNPIIPRIKQNGTPYKTCSGCRDREKARYQQRKGRL